MAECDFETVNYSQKKKNPHTQCIAEGNVHLHTTTSYDDTQSRFPRFSTSGYTSSCAQHAHATQT